MLLEEGDDAIVEEIGGGQRGLSVVKLGEPDLGVGVDKGLLIDPADALQRAGILIPTLS